MSQKFRPAKNPIPADAPSRQPDIKMPMPVSKPKKGPELDEALKLKNLTTKPTPLKNDPADIPSCIRLGMHGLAFAKMTQNSKIDQ